MTFKVNYGFQKAERLRAKLAKKEAKRREKEDVTEQAKTESAASPEHADSTTAQDEPS
jgi:hypothetical protein